MMAYIAGQIAEAGKPELEKYVYLGREIGREIGYKMQQNCFKIGVFI
jgi:hypothetical protein